MPHFPPSDLPLTPRGSCTMRPGTSCARVLADSLNNALEGPRGHASSPTGCEDCLCEERKQPRETIAAPPWARRHACPGRRVKAAGTRAWSLLLSAPEIPGEKSLVKKNTGKSLGLLLPTKPRTSQEL